MFFFEKYIEKMMANAKEKETILCFGMDPVVERIPLDYGKEIEERITSFFCSICDELIKNNLICAIKPNYAFYAQYGFEGLRALKKIIDKYKGVVEVILDGKRGDIGKTSHAYAREVFEFWQADATTLSPYMWDESILPFVSKGFCYVLCRTTNPSATIFQEKRFEDGEFVYEFVAKQAIRWKSGLVVGATSKVIQNIAKQWPSIPLLIPGIGAQGGDLTMVLNAIKKNKWIHRINVSSSLSYAHEKTNKTPENAALEYAFNIVEKMKNGTAEI